MCSPMGPFPIAVESESGNQFRSGLLDRSHHWDVLKHSFFLAVAHSRLHHTRAEPITTTITTNSNVKSSAPTMFSSHLSEAPRLRVVRKTRSKDAHRNPPHSLFNDPVPPPTLAQPSDTNRPPASQMPMPQTADMTPDEIFRTIIDYFTNPFKPSLPCTSGTSKSNASLHNATQQVSLYTATAPLVLFFLFVPLSCALLHTRVSVGQGPRSQKNRILSFTRDMHFWLRGVFGIAGDSSGGDGDMITLVDVVLVLGLIVLVLVLWRIIIVLGGYTATWITSQLAEEAEREGEGGEEVYGMGVRGFGKYVMIKDGEKAMEERERMLMSIDLQGAESFEGVVESGSVSDDDDDEGEEEEGVQRASGLTALSLCL